MTDGAKIENKDNLATEELRNAREWRLIEEGLADVRAGRMLEVTPEYFDRLRAYINELANKPA